MKSTTDTRRITLHEAKLSRAMPVVTQAADGTPRPMLCSYLEWLAVDAATLRSAIAAGRDRERALRAAGGSAAR